MEALEIQKNFHVELLDLLKKYKAAIIIEDFSRTYMSDEKIVINFCHNETLFEENGNGIIPDLVLGRYVG